jgi:small-conductance mechanosensitive channel
MKLLIRIFCIISFSGFIAVEVAAQEQQANTQAVQASQETQTATTAQNNQVQTQSQTKNVSAPKPKPFADDLSIADQFQFAIDKSSNFQDYKVIKQIWITRLKSNTLDTLLTLKTNLKGAKDLVHEKATLIESLQSELNITQSDLKKKNSFSFFGIMVSKSGYDSIMWAIIIGLLVGLGFIIAAFRRSYTVISQTKKDLNDLKDEFELYRKKALKSKEEAVRQLYDELNKYKNKK